MTPIRCSFSCALGLALAACASTPAGTGSGRCKPGGDGGYLAGPYPTLSDYCLVGMTDAGIQPLPGVLPYDLNTPLFSDYAVKLRTIWMPPGTSATYDPVAVFAFPDGAIITKSFGLPDDLRKASPIVHWIETRVLIKAAGAWTAHTYTWNDAQTEATLNTAGEVLPTPIIDYDGGTETSDYLVPTPTQCLLCHTNGGSTSPIGPKARQLNRTYADLDGGLNELIAWTEAGFLSGAPDPADAPRLAVWDDPTTGTLEERARAYLEGNCAHCHSAEGTAGDGGLFLFADETDPSEYGVCKEPAASPATAGYSYDIVPGSPQESFLWERLSTTAPGVIMPPLSRSLDDVVGIALVGDWITSLDGGCE